MNYEKIYNALVEKAKVRGLNKSKVPFYTEAHHIIPVCIGGTDSAENFVLFSGREHFIAHMLLWKANPDNVSLMRAAHIMSSRWVNNIAGNSHVGINSKVYSKLREEYSQAVSAQCSGENNPMFGVTHPPELLEQIKASRRITERKKKLINWKQNNTKYMEQFIYKKDCYQDFLINVGSHVPIFRHKGELKDWLAFNVFKDFWERSEKTGPKDFSTKVNKVSGRDFSASYFRTMSERFQEGFDPSLCSGYLVKALNNNSDQYLQSLEKDLSKTIRDIEKEYIEDWMLHRNSHRDKISKAIEDLGIKKHKLNSKAIFSLVDVVEALILWRSGFVEQKFLASLYGVARNSVSNTLENKDRWLEVKNNIEQIEVSVLGKCNRTRQSPSGHVFIHP